MSSDSDDAQDDLPLAERWKRHQIQGDEMPTGFVEPREREKAKPKRGKYCRLLGISFKTKILLEAGQEQPTERKKKTKKKKKKKKKNKKKKKKKNIMKQCFLQVHRPRNG